jgi:hypothetical protein
MPPRTKTAKLQTTAQQLGSIIKSARQIMRKDKGLNGDLDRLPMLTWVMFLKFLDDMEQMRETNALLQGKPFQPAIRQPYRWRDWAADAGGITGEDLIAFINSVGWLYWSQRTALVESVCKADQTHKLSPWRFERAASTIPQPPGTEHASWWTASGRGASASSRPV